MLCYVMSISAVTNTVCRFKGEILLGRAVREPELPGTGAEPTAYSFQASGFPNSHRIHKILLETKVDWLVAEESGPESRQKPGNSRI